MSSKNHADATVSNNSKDKIKIFTEIQPSTVELETIECNILLYNNYSITPNKH